MKSILDEFISVMPRLLRRRSTRSRLLRLIFFAFIIAAAFDSIFFVWNFSSQASQQHRSLAKTSSKLFISSTHWNNEPALRGFWNKAVVDLAHHVGPDNLYVSVYESGSWDNSKDALKQLDKELSILGVHRTIVLDETTHEDEITKTPSQSGWIDTPRGRKELRRIPFLSRLRNLTLKPMIELADNGTRFDKVLFLNDVAFTVSISPIIPLKSSL